MILSQDEVNELTRKKYPATNRGRLESWIDRVDAVLASADKPL